MLNKESSKKKSVKSKVKGLLAVGLAALALTACNDDKTNYQGTYTSNESSIVVILEKMDNSTDYKLTEERDGKASSIAAKIKDQKYLYSSQDKLLGEFNGETLKTTQGKTYTKLK